MIRTLFRRLHTLWQIAKTYEQDKAALLKELSAEFANVPEENYTVRITDGKNGNRMLTSSPRLKPGDSLDWSLMSQTDDEDIPRRIHVPVVFRPAGATRPPSYPQRT